MAKKNTGKSYEELVREIYQVILDYENKDDNYRRIEVQHNVELKGNSGNLHQIDVFWSFELAGIEYKTLIEVKDWKKPVKKEQLHSFISVLDDIPGSPRGCFVSRSGFQSGAVTAAKHRGIKLVKIEASAFRIVINNIVTYYNGVELSVDEDWAEKQGLHETDASRLIIAKTQEEVILLSPKKVKVRLIDLMCNDARPYYYEEDDVHHTIKTTLKGDWYLLTDDPIIEMIKVLDYKFECYNKSASTGFELTLPQYLITDILEEKKHLYDTVAKVIKLDIS